MNRLKSIASLLLITAAVLAGGTPALALTGIQIGPSGKTYMSADLACALHPLTGMAPMVQAGLYNPKRAARGVVSLDGDPLATVTFVAPDTTVWLASGVNAVTIALNRRVDDAYSFDAAPAFAGQPNVCVPDTRGNTVGADLETAESGKSSVTVTAGCALNPLTGIAQPFVHLFDNGPYLLNVSINHVPLTQLNGSTHSSVPVFLVAGLNVITAANGAVSIDSYVRDGGTGRCTLP